MSPARYGHLPSDTAAAPIVLVMALDDPGEQVHWVRSVGGPRPGDPRDGELHRFSGRLPDEFDLEPWDADADGLDAHYVRDTTSPPVMEEGRRIWRFVYQPPARS